MTYIDRNIVDFDFEAELGRVSPQRHEKVNRIIPENSRRQSVAAFRLLQKALEKEYGITGKIEFAFADKGKPYLPEYPAVYFNMSHCRKAVAVAVGDEPVGVDIEEICPFDKELAQRVLSEDELEFVTHSDSPAVEFTKLWTLKEGYLKMTGEGLVDNITSLCVDNVIHETIVDKENGFVCTVVGGNNQKWAE